MKITARPALTLLVAFALCIAAFSPLSAGERVIGASAVAGSATLEEAFDQVATLPLQQREIDLFISIMSPLSDWFENNSEQWSNTKGQEPLAALRGLGAWAGTGISADEFFALSAKVAMAKNIADGAINADNLLLSMAVLDGLLEDRELSEERRAQFVAARKGIEAQLDLLERYPQENIELYKANRESVETVIERFEGITFGHLQPQ